MQPLLALADDLTFLELDQKWGVVPFCKPPEIRFPISFLVGGQGLKG
jgi:hypothetical protein